MSHTVAFCYLCHFLQVMLDAEDSWLSQRLQIFVQQGEAGPIAPGIPRCSVGRLRGVM